MSCRSSAKRRTAAGCADLSLRLPSPRNVWKTIALRDHVAPLFLFSGIAILGYVGVQYGVMVLEQHHLQTLWKEQQLKVGPRLARHVSTLFPEDSLSRLTIPAINFSAVIVEGTDPISLMLGPGHMTGTSLPGNSGNIVISAHREIFFRRIGDLKQGDRILIERDGQTFTYAVDHLKLVKPADVSVIAATHDNRLTLITCDPAYHAGPAPQRLVVISKLLGTLPSTLAPRIEIAKPSRSHMHVHQAAVKKPSTRQAN